MSINELLGKDSGTRTGLASMRTLDWLLVVAAFGLAAGMFLLGEKIQTGEGMGWDGQYYGAWAKDFYSSVIQKGVDDYLIQRIFPSAVVHYSLRLISSDLTNANIIRGFGALNVAMITASALLWSLIANELQIGPKGKILGFVSMFINFGLLKFPSYYPVLTDFSCFAISMAMLYSYLTAKRLSLFALTAVGSAVWPTLAYEGALLLLFPRIPDDFPVAPAPARLNRVAALLVALAMAGYMAWLSVFRIEDPIQLPVLGIAGCFLYLFFGLSILLDSRRLFDIKGLASRAMSPSFFATLLFVVGINWLLYSLSTKQSKGDLGFSSYGLAWAITETAILSFVRPLIFILSDVVFFGPIIIVAMFRFKSVCPMLQRYGTGLVLCVILGFILSLNSDPRKLMNFLPLFVPFLIKDLEYIRWRGYHYWLFGLISLIFSKVWLRIDGDPEASSDLYEYTCQSYFMNFGCYMSAGTYVIQGIAVIVTAVLLYRFCHPRQPSYQPGIQAS